MAQLPVELILVRQLAHGLAVPTFVVDADGDLVFVNEAAEALLGLDFEDAGQVSFMRIVGRDGVLRSLVVTALPLEGSRGQLLGGLAMFWEPPTR